jgi:hypothetical protein
MEPVHGPFGAVLLEHGGRDLLGTGLVRNPRVASLAEFCEAFYKCLEHFAFAEGHFGSALILACVVLRSIGGGLVRAHVAIGRHIDKFSKRQRLRADAFGYAGLAPKKLIADKRNDHCRSRRAEPRTYGTGTAVVHDSGDARKQPCMGTFAYGHDPSLWGKVGKSSSKAFSVDGPDTFRREQRPTTVVPVVKEKEKQWVECEYPIDLRRGT